MIENELNKTKSSRAYILAVICAILFMNPTVRLVDILPDFVACIIIAYILRAPAERAPYFSEARSWFIKYGISSVAKLPAFYVLTMVRGANVSDYDISALLTFSFAVIDAVLLTLAVKNLFSALSYLGERSDLSAAILPFSISKRAHRKMMTPEGLLRLTLVFTYFKLAAGSLPELLLLSGTVDNGAYQSYISYYSVYPYVIILAVLATLIFGIVFASRFAKYLSAIAKDASFYSAVDSLVPEGGWDDLNRQMRKKELCFTFGLMPVAALFSLIVRFDNLREINLVPLAVLGLILLYALFKIHGKAVVRSGVFYAGITFTLLAVIYQVAEACYLDEYGYSKLVNNAAARSAYLPTMISGIGCFVAFCAFVILFAHSTYGFISKTVLCKISADGRAEMERGYAKRLAIWCGSGILALGARFADLIFRYYPDLIVVSRDHEIIGDVTAGFIPWFGTVVVALSVLFTLASHLTASTVKDEIDGRL